MSKTSILTWCVSQQMHQITNLWKFGLKWSSKLQENYERKQPCWETRVFLFHYSLVTLMTICLKKFTDYVIYAYLLIHQVRILNFDNHQKCPITKSVQHPQCVLIINDPFLFLSPVSCFQGATVETSSRTARKLPKHVSVPTCTTGATAVTHVSVTPDDTKTPPISTSRCPKPSNKHLGFSSSSSSSSFFRE